MKLLSSTIAVAIVSNDSLLNNNSCDLIKYHALRGAEWLYAV